MYIISEGRHLHLMGIGGVAMATLAVMLKKRGFIVSGSDDQLYPPSRDILKGQGVQIYTGYDEGNLAPRPDLVIIGNAISRGNPEVEAVLEGRLPFRSMPEVLRDLFLQGRRSAVVTGTHGKTTTTTLLGWILLQAGMDPSYMAGGVSLDLKSTFRLGGGDIFVIEGDEYDSAFFDKRPKFLHYLPHLVTIGNIEFDHADIYAGVDEILLQFQRLLRIVPRNGAVVINADDPNARAISARSPCEVITCGMDSEDALWRAKEVRVHEDGTRFLLYRGDSPVGMVSMGLAGRHNVINALLSIASAEALGVPPGVSMQAAQRFHGVNRRLQRLGRPGGVFLYDDFAHHPTAVKAVLRTLREMHPGARIWAVLEPRSHSIRRKVFEDRLCEALSGSDGAIIGPLYRPQAIDAAQRMDPRAVAKMLKEVGKEAWHMTDLDEIVDILRERVKPGDVVCLMSSGPFGGLAGRLLSGLDSS